MREMFGQSDTEKNISFSKCAAAAPRRATPRHAAPRPHFCPARTPPECCLRRRGSAAGLGRLSTCHSTWAGALHARASTHAHARAERGGDGSEGGRGSRRAHGEAGRGRGLALPCCRTRALCSPSRFVAIQKRSSNLKDGKQSAAMVPQVKGLAYVTDPSMQHLL